MKLFDPRANTDLVVNGLSHANGSTWEIRIKVLSVT